MPSTPPSSAADGPVRPSTVRLAARLRTSRDHLSTTWNTRVGRLRDSAWQIGQCAVGAGLAWWLAHLLLHHRQPFFAPVAAIVTLGLNWGARLGRLFEIVLGASIGILLGEVLVSVLGHGYWQLPVVIAIAMATAVFTGVGALMSTQAGVQAVMVTVVLPDAGQGISRWEDALLGGSLGILIAALFSNPTPLIRPRQLAADAVRETADLLTECARACEDLDVERARRTLDRARQAQQGRIDELHSAADAGLDVVTMSPWFQRHHRPALRHIAELAVPLDLAMRSERVVIRRVLAVVRRDEQVPAAVVTLLRQIADACDQLARDLVDVQRPGPGTRLLGEAARASAQIPVGHALSVDVLLEQTRSMLVDLLQVAGLDYDTALEAIARPREPRRDAVSDA